MNFDSEMRIIENTDLQQENEKLRAERDRLREALKKAVSAGEFVVKIVEDCGNCGASPNPSVRSDWLGTAMHCYAAMHWLGYAHAALHPTEPKSEQL